GDLTLFPFSMPAFLTRRVSFAAAHRYRIATWSDERNEQVFGLCARPSYHGHSYVCDVTVRGEIHETTGMVIDLGILDRMLDVEVRQRFDHRNINVDVVEFGEGRLVPTGENLARFIYERIAAALRTANATARVVKVTVAEDATLSASYSED
ncbi:MAG TPA: 6-carboxytetrahydropterin synthase, partial [Gemmatimonadaceae bacterium]|nr:6-carboxytetrahydropterin synthase [Gemmatimonadaceae bacterium]